MNETAETILDIAQNLIQSRGFNAFSYADIAKEIGIKTASIHYHFPSKSDLVRNLVERYRSSILTSLKQIELSNSTAHEKLRSFLDLYLDKLHEEQTCLCVMLASDIHTLASEVQIEIKGFIAENEGWLATVLRGGRNDGSLKIDGNVELKAKLFFSTVQGALLLSKALNSGERFMAISQELVNSYSPRT